MRKPNPTKIITWTSWKTVDIVEGKKGGRKKGREGGRRGREGKERKA